MKIKNIHIKNFLNIEDLLVDFTINSNRAGEDVNSDTYDRYKNIVSPRIFGFIGPNSIGKSNILESLRIVFYAIENRFIFDAAYKIQKNMSNNLNREEEEKLIKDMKDRYLSNLMEEEEREKFDSIYLKIISNFHFKRAINKKKPIIFEIIYFKKNFSEEKIIIQIDGINGLKVTGNIDDINFRVAIMNKNDFYTDEAEMFKVSQIESTIIRNKFDVKKILKIIQIADPNIQDLKKSENGDILLLTHQGAVIKITDLSTGTKLYLNEALAILDARKPGIYLIDEIDTFMHRELSQSLIAMMNMVVLKNKDINFIFTTHNHSIIGEDIKFKQIIELKKVGPNDKLIAEKLSKILKPKSSLNNMILNGMINTFPSKSFVFDHLYEVVNE